MLFLDLVQESYVCVSLSLSHLKPLFLYMYPEIHAQFVTYGSYMDCKPSNKITSNKRDLVLGFYVVREVVVLWLCYDRFE